VPELPEVETIVRAIRPRLVGQTIRDLHCTYAQTLRPHLAAARRMVVGRRVADAGRRGKYVVLQLASGAMAGTIAVLIHLRMSGRLAIAAREAPRESHLRLRFGLDDGNELRFVDARKFGRVIVTPRPQEVLDSLGVEPLADELTPAALSELIRTRARMLKPLLLDQRVIAGIGNIYADEALHRAGLHPCRNSRSLNSQEVARLHDGIRSALADGIAANGASIDWVYPGGAMQEQFRVYGRAGQPCRRCGRRIRRMVVAQRGTHYCPRCQGSRR
jgi:formamidopyrimidine-DNA glycosylase